MRTILFITALFMSTLLSAQKPVEIPLWPNGAPNTNGLTGDQEDLDGGRVANVINPTITVYRPAKPNGMTILMCPGGGYARPAMNHEGHDMASWFNTQGITYAVLKYRMPNGNREVPLSDAEQAIRIIRQHAKEWGINPNQVGVMGASAGGHLAASLSTLYSSDETRPDFQILLYPVISMVPGITHGGSRKNLLGDNPTKELEDAYSLERRVSPRSPQAFIVLSADDGAVPPMNSIGYFLALNQQKVPVSMHIYPIGGHGWGFRDNFTYKRQWTEELEKWLRDGVKFEKKITNISTHEKIDFYHLPRITTPRPSGTGRPLRPVDQSEVDQYQQRGSPEYIHFLCHRRRCYRQRPDERSQPPIPQREMEVQLCGKLLPTVPQTS